MPTKIAWTDETWNPVVGCTKCSPGCKNCYAERMAIRLNGMFATRGDDDNWAKMTNILKWDYSEPERYEFGRATGWNGEVELFCNRLNKPLTWKKPRRIFVCSMSDLFHPKVPFEFIHKVFSVTQEAWCHKYLILTKRPERLLEFTQTCARHDKCGQLIESGMGKYYHSRFAWPHDNLHLGVSISTQAELCKAKVLADIPAAVRYISFEPLLEDIHIGSGSIEKMDWAIFGCESGPNRRECKNEWIGGLVKHFRYFSKPVFVKQLSINGKVSRDPKEWPKDLRVQDYP